MNVKENGNIVQRYVQKLTSDLTYLENQTFTISIEEITYFVEFKVQSVPSDMKMLAFLGGELSNAAFYFTTFANVNKKDCNDVTKSFSLDGSKSWKAFDYEKRLSDAALAIAKKKELSTKAMTQSTRQSKLTAYISTDLKGRQDKVPLLGKYIDLASCELLHLKNNTVKEMFMKILKIVLYEASLSNEIKLFKEIPASSIFFIFVDFVKTEMNSNFLGKKIIAWFNENRLSKQEREFGFRFRGKESHNYLKGFPSLILMPKLYLSEQNLTHLVQFHYESLCLRKLVS